MPSNPRRPGSPPIAKPVFQALHRLEEREVRSPDQVTRRASALLTERFGPSSSPVYAQFVPASAGLMSEHTHYFDGFALMMPVALGTAIALRETNAGASRLVFEGGGTHPLTRRERSGARADAPLWECVLDSVIWPHMPPEADLEIAVVHTGPDLDRAPSTMSFALALSQAVEEAYGPGTGAAEQAEREEKVTATVERCAARPFSIAYAIAASVDTSGPFVLVDAGTRERLTLEAPPGDVMGWALVQVGSEPLDDAVIHRERKEAAGEALALLQEQGFRGLTSFRELEHRDLDRALKVLPGELRPFVRYLVGENRRVQKLATAIRRRDWQMFGALLLMSHASQRNDLGRNVPEIDAVVEQVEQMSIEGMYGATTCGWGRYVLITGQPFVVPVCLDRIQEELETRFGITPATVLF